MNQLARMLRLPILSVLILAPHVHAVAEEASPPIEFLNSGKVVPTTLPFSEAVRVGDMLYLSGQIGIKPGTLDLAPGGIEGEARQTLDNIRTSLEAHGYALRDVVKCTVMLADIAEWATFNEVYRSYFSPPYPARSALGANGLALGARVEVECIAAKR
jgi:reactive intermediate/imine deaminase